MKDLVRYLSKAIVEKAHEVVVNEIKGDEVYVIELYVAKEDLGLLIGKKGRNISAIRTILRSVAAKNKKKVVLEVIEDAE